jgi:ATP-dependent Zn protease
VDSTGKKKLLQSRKLDLHTKNKQYKLKNKTIDFVFEKLTIHSWFFFIILILGNLQASYGRYPFLLNFNNIQLISWQDFAEKKYFRKASKQKYRVSDKYFLATIVHDDNEQSQTFQMNLPPSTSQNEIFQIIKKTIISSSAIDSEKPRDSFFIDNMPTFLWKVDPYTVKNDFNLLRQEKKANFQNLNMSTSPLGYVFFCNTPDYVFRSFLFQGTNLLYLYVAVFPFWFALQIIEKLEAKKKNWKITKAIIKKPYQNKKRLEDLAGLEKIKPNLEELIHSLKSSQFYQSSFDSRRPIPKGYLFVGPPGTGKTLLAQAIAGTAQVPLFATVASEFLDSRKGAGCARLRDVFSKAKKASPAILFIDEIDTLGKARTGTIDSLNHAPGTEEKLQIFTEFLVQLDGFSKQDKVVIIGATNFSDSLDTAFIRPGRFDRVFQLEYPHHKARTAILKLHVDRHNKKRGKTLIDWGKLSQLTVGFTGADLAAMVNESLLYAIRIRDKTVHDTVTLEHGFYRIATYSQPQKLQNSWWGDQEKLFTETCQAYYKGSKQLFAIYFKKSFGGHLTPPVLFLKNRPKKPRYLTLENEGKKTRFELLPKKYLKIELMNCLIGIAAESYLLEKLSSNQFETNKLLIPKPHFFWTSRQGEKDLQEASYLVNQMISEYAMIDETLFFKKFPSEQEKLSQRQNNNWKEFWMFFQTEFSSYLIEENDTPIQINWRFFKSWSWLETNQIYVHRKPLPWDESILDEKKQENRESISPNLFYRATSLEVRHQKLQKDYDELLRQYLKQALYEANFLIKKNKDLLDLTAYQLLLKNEDKNIV